MLVCACVRARVPRGRALQGDLGGVVDPLSLNAEDDCVMRW